MIFKHYYYLHVLKYEKMEITIKEFIAGAREAEGTTVIIDVFRAFSVACFAFDSGIKRLINVASPEIAFDIRKRLRSDTVLVGERDEKRIPGFDFGNSPTEMLTGNLAGKTMLHTTTAGTNGILSASGASEVLGASLVNASATARYIMMTRPANVTLVAMGYRATKTADEDIICAEYIREMLRGNERDITAEITALRTGSGSRFFEHSNVSFSPPTDFFLCTDMNRFNFVLKAVVISPEQAELFRLDMVG